MSEYQYGNILAYLKEVTCQKCKKLRVIDGEYYCGNDPVWVDVSHKCEEFEEHTSKEEL